MVGRPIALMESEVRMRQMTSSLLGEPGISRYLKRKYGTVCNCEFVNL